MTWWQRLWRKAQQEEQLDKELQFHLDQHANDLIAQGFESGEARRRARVELGGPEQVKEDCRDARGTRWVDELAQDLRYAVRTLRQRPGFAAVALCTLALGSGATTVMFTVINGVLLKPLAYPDADRLVVLNETTESNDGVSSFAYLNYLDCKRQSHSLANMAAWRSGGGTISEPGEAEYVSGRQISADLFNVLGIELPRGRAFHPEEDRPGASPVAIISDRLWQRRFAGSPEAVGARLVFAGRSYSVVGILPVGFRLGGDADVMTPIGQNTEPTIQDREMHPGIRVVARLAPGVTPSQVRAELGVIGRRLAEQFPKSNAGRGFVAKPLGEELVADVRSTLWLLLGAVSLVMLIACVNVSSLLLARAISRERELAMRVALGAGRGRLVRQCLTESATLALVGGALGVALAAAGVQPFLTYWPGSLPRAEEIHLNWRVLLFSVAASLFSGLLFGLVPAFRAPAVHLEQALRAGSRTLTGGSRRLHGGFVVSEIALAVVLLVASGMLGRTLLRLASTDPGVDVHNVLISHVALSANALSTPTSTRVAWQDVLDRVRSVPGVQSAAVSELVPMDGEADQIGYWTGDTAPPQDRMPLGLMNIVTPSYLKTMRIPLHQGRFFDDHDRRGSELVVAIDQVMSRRLFGAESAVGKRLTLQFLGPARIVGVVGHVRHWGLDADDSATIREQVYLPFAQLPDPYMQLASAMSMMVRTSGPPLEAVEAIRRQVRGGARDQALYDVRTMEDVASATVARQRFLMVLFGVFAGLALLLASIGIYGVLAYLTAQRVPEIGVRLALGATSTDVMRMVFRQSLGMVLIGVVLGTAAALAAGRLLERLVSGVRPAEPLTFTGMISLLVAAALLASFIPARRASRVDPIRALRQE